MSYPHQVPKGWVKGERLQVYGTGPRYGLTVAPSSSFSEFEKRLEAMEPDGFAIITFDSKNDLDAFLKWWNE